jgi:hypothetical protein
MKTLGYVVLVIAACVSLVFVHALQPTSLGAAAFLAAWLVLPYAVLALAVRFFARTRAAAIACLMVTVAVAGGGLLFLTNLIFLHPDPQGGIAVVFTPIYQAIGIAVLLPVCHWLVGRARAQP